MPRGRRGYILSLPCPPHIKARYVKWVVISTLEGFVTLEAQRQVPHGNSRGTSELRQAQPLSQLLLHDQQSSQPSQKVRKIFEGIVGRFEYMNTRLIFKLYSAGQSCKGTNAACLEDVERIPVELTAPYSGDATNCSILSIASIAETVLALWRDIPCGDWVLPSTLCLCGILAFSLITPDPLCKSRGRSHDISFGCYLEVWLY